MENIHPFWVTLQCVITASSLWLVLIGIGKFYCVEWMEEMFDSLADEIDGIALWAGVATTLCLIGVWVGYWTQVEPLYVISYFLCGMATFFYWFLGMVITVNEFIIPKISDMHHEIRRKKNSRY